MNIERYKRTVSIIAWVQLSLVFCYFPMFSFLILSTVVHWYKVGSVFNVFALTVVYFNCTLNPILYCWEIREVREAVKQVPCFSG